MKRLLALGLLGCSVLTMMPLGCGHRIEYPPLKNQSADAEGPSIPRITAERLGACVDEFAGELEKPEYTLRYRVRADEQGRVLEVLTNDVPNPDLAACTRVALGDMAVPAAALQLRQVGDHISKSERPAAARNALGNVIVVGILVTLTELAIKAGGITILFAITVELVDTAAKEIAEALRRRKRWENECEEERTKCLLTDLADEPGDIYSSSRCSMCYRGCMANKGNWPSRMVTTSGDWVSCAYWKPKWRR